MKYSALLFTFLLSIFLNANAGAQVSVDIYADLSFGKKHSTHDESFRKEVRELNEFRKKVDRFIISSGNGEWVKADFVKSSIIRDMKDEIQQTQLKIRHFHSSESYNRREPEVYSKRQSGELQKKSRHQNKRKGHSYGDNYELNLLQKRLHTQKHLLEGLMKTRIGSGRKAWKRSKQNERLMLKFEDILVDEIRYIKKDFHDEYAHRYRKGY